MSRGAPATFGPAVLSGLAELGPVDPFSGDLSLELGLSVWMRTSGTSLDQARHALLALREHIVDACGLDPATEPVPLVGRSARTDVVTLIGYLGQLLRRGAAVAGLSPRGLAERVVAELPPSTAETALGA